MTNSRNILWKRRRDLPELSLAAQLIMAVAIVAGSALIGLIPGLSGLLFTAVSGALFAFLLCTSRKPIHLMAVPLSFICAFLISDSPKIALASLLYVPLGLALAYCIFTKRGLSVTCIPLTVLLLLSMAVFLTIAVVNMYGLGIKESYKALYDEFSAYTRELFSVLTYPAPDGTVYSVPDEAVSAFIDTSVMLLPCMCVLCCELFAYVCAKLFRLFSIIFGYNVFFGGKRWAVTLSAPAGAILMVSLFIGMCSRNTSVIAYSAINLAYIIMPFGAIAGFHDVFGKDGLFRRQPNLTGRIVIIVACAFMGFLSPLHLAQMLAIIGSMSAIGRLIASLIKKHRDKNEKDPD